MRERAAIVALGPVDKADAFYQLALAQHEAGDDAHARTSVLRSLEEAPNFEKAQTLLLTLYDARDQAGRREATMSDSAESWESRARWAPSRSATAVRASRPRRGGGFERILRQLGRLLPAAGVPRQPAVRRPLHVRAHQVPRLRAHVGREGPGWSHDYPDAEENFTKILRDITAVRPFVEQGPIVGSVLVALDDPLLFKYPVSYMSEPGGWHPNDKEIAAFRAYFLKGGFMIFDDFREGWRGQYDWTNLRSRWRARYPEREVGPADRQGADLRFVLQDRPEGRGRRRDVGVRNEPADVLGGVPGQRSEEAPDRCIANVDNDIGESWQWSAIGLRARSPRRTRPTSWVSTT